MSPDGPPTPMSSIDDKLTAIKRVREAVYSRLNAQRVDEDARPYLLAKLLFGDLEEAVRNGAAPIGAQLSRSTAARDLNTNTSSNTFINSIKTVANALRQCRPDDPSLMAEDDDTAGMAAVEALIDGVLHLVIVRGPTHAHRNAPKTDRMLRLQAEFRPLARSRDLPNASQAASTSRSHRDSPPRRPLVHILWLGLLFETCLGMAISLAYGLFSAGILYVVKGQAESIQFLRMYISFFGALVSFGLAIATALTVAHYQHLVPRSIEASFARDDLDATDYSDRRDRYYSPFSSMIFAMEFGILGFVISSMSHFPLHGIAESLLMIVSFTQWVLIGYVVRKLYYAFRMLTSVAFLDAGEYAFRQRQLDAIASFMRVVTTMGVIFFYVLGRTYYYAPFLYDSAIGTSARVFLLGAPAAATAAFLVFNFLPRETLRQIYENALDDYIAERPAPNESQILIETRLREDLRRTLRPNLADLPIALAALATLLKFTVYW
ncbi:MAG TPA: hypothetical protein VHT23_04495 [Gemmatimonadaceae bacterium]|nr:hypothetical protein [Gemmatimonadaceae bacterium]